MAYSHFRACGSDREKYFNSEECRIILIGKTGAGKSTTGNKILGRKAFYSKFSMKSVTGKCQSEIGTFEGRTVQVVDTPGLFDTGMTVKMVNIEIVKCVGLSAPGPHAIILVIELGRFTEEEQNVVQHFKTIFGDDMMKYLILLFTGKDKLQRENIKLKDALQELPEINDILRECNNRVIAFSLDDPSEVSELFGIIFEMVAVNGNCFYTCEYFEKTEKLLRQREEEIMRIEEEKQKVQERQKQEIQEMKTEIKQHKEEKETILQRYEEEKQRELRMREIREQVRSEIEREDESSGLFMTMVASFIPMSKLADKILSNVGSFVRDTWNKKGFELE